MPRCKVPYSVWLLIDFIWFLAAAILIFSDVVFDVLTCIRYFREGWYVAFAVSILLLFLPSTLIGIADYYNINIIVTDRSDKDDLKRKGKKRIRKEDVSCEHNIRLSAETLTARQVRPENEQQEILFMNSSLLTQNCSGSPNSLVQNSTFEHDVDRDLEKFANINQSEAPLAHSEGETTSLIMLENRDENNYSQSRADVSVQTEEVDGKGECRGPTYLYYRSTALPQHLSNNFLTTAPVVPRHDGRENNTENPPTEQAEGTHPEDTSDGRCESFICSRRLHLLLNIWGLQLAVFGRRFLLAVRFGQRWFRYIRFNSEQRRFHRENERKVVRGKVAYDLAENEVQQHYLDLINEDEALLPLWIIESLTESLPQLLINLYLIVKYRRQLLLQYISASLSFLTLTWGVTSPEKQTKEWIVCKNLPTCINCYVKRGAVALLPVKRDHIYVDHRVRPIDGQRFYFGTDTVFCACPDNVHDAAVIEGDEDVSDESKSWVKCYDAGRIRDGDPACHEPTRDGDPACHEPTRDGDPACHEPTRDGDPACHEPTRDGDPACHEPTRDGDPACHEPTRHGDPACHEPTRDGDPACHEPTRDGDPACHEPTRDGDPACHEPTRDGDPACHEPTRDGDPACHEPTRDDDPACHEPTRDGDPACHKPTRDGDPSCHEPTRDGDPACHEPTSLKTADIIKLDIS
uniref:XK-related protein n=1 Tax=Saccoglossus kowalevskii TaxID=10224 RepID=A0ABM0LZY6_SACKO|nr:PREDICTED: uncharacterized protein LOC102807952 [Saccoglossus kowalevskii]